MDAAEPRVERDKEGDVKVSININSPSDNRIAGRDFIEVNIHLYDRAKLECATEQESTDAAEPIAVHTMLTRLSPNGKDSALA